MKEENLNHIPQADPLDTVKEGTQPPVKSQYDGMTEQEIFKIVTRPEEIEGVEDWGIPPAADPKFCDPKLKVCLTFPTFYRLCTGCVMVPTVLLISIHLIPTRPPYQPMLSLPSTPGYPLFSHLQSFHA